MALSLIIQRRLTPQTGGLVCSGIPGRFAPEWVADLKRNQWPIWGGILMKTMKPDKCRIKALTKLGIKDRTYLTYVHEIHEENNARIRNAKTTILRRNVVSAKH